MKKQYCDFCDEEIDLDLGDGVSIYDYIKNDNEFQADICNECKKKILAFFETLEN